MRCNAQTKVKISGTTAGRRLASTLKATLTRNPVFARRGKMAVRGNQLLSTNPTKCRLATPNRCGQAFAVEFCGSMPALYPYCHGSGSSASHQHCAAYGQTPMH